MKIFTSDESINFEKLNQATIYHFENITQHVNNNILKDIVDISFAFNSILSSSDFGAVSEIDNSRFITFNHNDMYGILSYKDNKINFFTSPDYASDFANIILETYHNKYNPNSLNNYPKIEVVKKKTKMKK